MATANNAKNLTNQYGDATHFYGNGVNATRGQNNNVFYLERRAIEQATTNKVFSQFASRYDMPQHTGREFRVSVSYNSYDRFPFTDATWNDRTGQKWTDAFAKYGFMAERDVADVSGQMFGEQGKDVIGNIGDNGFRLIEGQLSGNKISMKSTTISTSLVRFGATIDFTDEAITFDDTYGMSAYYEQLAGLIRQLNEDAVQYDMLGTPNVMFAGAATSKATLGKGIGTGAVDQITGVNAVEESFKINWDLIQKAESRLINFRAPKHTKILSGSTNVDTKTINECYAAIVGSQVRQDLVNISRGPTVYSKDYVFNSVEKYSSQTSLMDGEVGSVGNMRFCASEQTMCFRGAGAKVEDGYTGKLSYTEVNGEKHFDVFPVIIPCKDSFATVGLQGKDKISWKSKAPGTTDTVDNYGSYAYFSASFYYAGIIKRPERLMVLYVLASA